MLVILFRLLSILPLPVLHGLGVALGWLAYLSAPSYRRRLKDNLVRAGYGEHLHAAIAEAGKNIAELPFIWCASPRRMLKSVIFENWEMAQEEFDAGQGVIFLTPHLGCFEVTAQAASTRIPLTVMYRPPRKALLKPLMEDARARHDLRLAPATLAGVRILLKQLRNNTAIGVLPDQVPQQGEGVWADFFGRPAYTMTLPAKLNKISGAPIILTYAERLPRGKGYVIRFWKLDAELPDNAQQAATAINAAMERLIARCPAQYFWSYNRYKAPAGAGAPPHAAEHPA